MGRITMASELIGAGGEPDLSVIICTHNRADSLDRTLRSIDRAVRPRGCRWELLIVDNRSADRTPAVASAWTERLPLQYVYEPEPGLSAARNRGVAEARGRLLAFTDDDVEVDPGWLTSLVAARDQWPKAGYLAGRILPAYEPPLPRWWDHACESLLSGVVVRFSPERNGGLLLPSDPRPMGANLAFDAAALRAVGGFRKDLGRRGASLVGGEEVAVMAALERAGFVGVYVPEAVVHHHTPTDRLRQMTLLRYFTAVGIAAVRMGTFSPANRLGPPRWWPAKVIASGFGFVRDRSTQPAARWLTSMRTFCFYVGAGIELLRKAPHDRPDTSAAWAV